MVEAVRKLFVIIIFLQLYKASFYQQEYWIESPEILKCLRL